MDIANLGERIRALRIRKGLKQREVADSLGIGRSAYAMYEVGVRTLPLDKAVHLARLYEVSLDQLLSDTDIRKIHQELPHSGNLSIAGTPPSGSEGSLRDYCKRLEAENGALKNELLLMYRRQSELHDEIRALRRDQDT
ncbi:MAG: helix-turn-helix transcriptional regulator [Cyclobacteriaceae bacterium]